MEFDKGSNDQNISSNNNKQQNDSKLIIDKSVDDA